ncbi:hypothetical protein [Roseiconus lacunae]|uniref:hypothetical protein n=1 Tax=Roseiconus lacunae TaxID=2605694 RepID=UPI001E338024|nr:hypothetical protein [Roseiconus lacunae]MCD0462485.1 hypothetical protein [Roseiconus lacunae]
MLSTRINRRTLGAVVLVPMMIGCTKDTDRRLVEMANRHEQRQAAQTEQANMLHREVTAMQREVQLERAELGIQRDLLEAERRSFATKRRHDSMTATAVESVGLWLVCLLPVGVSWLLLRQSERSATDTTLIDVMLEDFISNKPTLLTKSTDSLRLRDVEPSTVPPE